MAQEQPSSLIRSLENLGERVKQRLGKLPAYRAFLAIEVPMAEVADIPDLLDHLETAKQKILDRLKITREYQALLTIERTIKEMTEVLEIVDDGGSPDAAPVEASATPVSFPKPPVATPHQVEVVGVSALIQEFARQA
jgi:hypothetical protein